jgi:16S rRNA (cytosine1402-N4)-methyltransferase
MRILREYGEERAARRVASAIVRRRKDSEISSTAELAGLIEKVLGRRWGAIHPATRTFQALRIAVNRELDALKVALPQAVSALRPGGRLVAISYHSLEDRIVKQTFREYDKGCVCPPSFPECRCGRVSEVRVLTRKPIRPSEDEVERNPRSRSARMRACERRKRNAVT